MSSSHARRTATVTDVPDYCQACSYDRHAPQVVLSHAPDIDRMLIDEDIKGDCTCGQWYCDGRCVYVCSECYLSWHLLQHVHSTVFLAASK